MSEFNPGPVGSAPLVGLPGHHVGHERGGVDEMSTFFAEVDDTNALITSVFGAVFLTLGDHFTDITALQALVAALTPQVVQASSVMGGTITGTSYGDISNATVTLTTSGRPCEIYVVGDSSVSEIDLRIDGGGTTSSGIVKCLLDGADITAGIFGDPGLPFVTSWSAWPIWRSTPAAGTHTFKLQGLVSNAGSVMTPRGRLVVREGA